MKTPKKMMKFDKGKPDLSMIPYEFLEEVAQVLMYGEKKYLRDNWQIGSDWSRAMSAAERHLKKYWWVADNDDESDLSHLAHAACNILFLIYYKRHKIGNDNRPKKGK